MKKDKVVLDGKDGNHYINPKDFIKDEDKNLYREEAKRLIKKQKKNKKGS